jgi:hypothetical protein
MTSTCPLANQQVERLLTTKGNSFEQQVIYRVSVAAAPLAAWVRANMAYSKVGCEVWGALQCSCRVCLIHIA